MWDSYRHMYSSSSEKDESWVNVPPSTSRDVHFGELAPDEELAPQEESHTQVQPEHAQDGQLYSIEDEIASEEPQVANALDGQPYNFVVKKENHFHCCPIAESLLNEDSESVSSHCSVSDPEFMGPTAEWKCISRKR